MGPYDKQIGGDHYLRMKIQPSEFANKNNLPFAEGNAIKYICRHKHKGKKEDLKKAKHYIDMIIERDYPDTAETKPLPKGFTLKPMQEEKKGPLDKPNYWGVLGRKKE
jgi:hypothetical protein